VRRQRERLAPHRAAVALPPDDPLALGDTVRHDGPDADRHDGDTERHRQRDRARELDAHTHTHTHADTDAHDDTDSHHDGRTDADSDAYSDLGHPDPHVRDDDPHADERLAERDGLPVARARSC
jgi:hypothetical protein